MSKLILIIGNKNYSSWSLRPWIFMKQAGIEFDEKQIPLCTKTTKESLEPYFSNHKVPVLIDGDLIVWDSLAILQYVAEKFPESCGWPENFEAKATARSVSAEMHSSFFALRNEMPMNCRKKLSKFTISSDAQTDIDRIKTVWKFCRNHFSKKGSWLFGDFCIADAMFAPVCFRFYTYNVPLEGFEKEYVRSMLSHPHIVEWTEAAFIEKEVLELFEVGE